MVSLKQMEALVWIVRLGSFERAAEKLHTTQSAISKRIRELELSCAVTIFDRSRRDARLTVAGEHVLAVAEQMLALQDSALSVSRGRIAVRQRLRLGITELTALTWLPTLVSHLKAGDPNLRLEPVVDMSRGLFQGLCDEALDLIVIPATFSAPEMTMVPLDEIETAWMTSPLLVPRSVQLKQLMAHSHITQGTKSGTGLIVSRWLKSRGLAVERSLSCDSLVAQIGLTVAGVGFSCLPRHCFEPLVAQHKLIRVSTKTPPPRVRYAAFYRADRPSGRAAEVANLCTELCDFKRAFALPV